MRFCGLSIADPVPDADTPWDFREALTGAGAWDQLLVRLDQAMEDAGYLPMSGQIVDARLVAASRQRNTEDEKAAIKAGRKASEIWPERPAEAAQKDTDASPSAVCWPRPFRGSDRRPPGRRRADTADRSTANGRVPQSSRQDQPHPPQQTRRQADAAADGQGQRQEIRGAVKGRTRLRAAETSDNLTIRSSGRMPAEATIIMANIAFNLGRWRW